MASSEREIGFNSGEEQQALGQPLMSTFTPRTRKVIGGIFGEHVSYNEEEASATVSITGVSTGLLRELEAYVIPIFTHGGLTMSFNNHGNNRTLTIREDQSSVAPSEYIIDNPGLGEFVQSLQGVLAKGPPRYLTSYPNPEETERVYQAIKKEKTPIEERVISLEKLLKNKGFIRVLEAHDIYSAHIVENISVNNTINGYRPVSFDAIWLNSLTLSGLFRQPDDEVSFPFDLRLPQVQHIADVTSKSLIYDGDTGGDPENCAHTVRELERIGVSAVIFEDKAKKENSLKKDGKHVLEDVEVVKEKLRAAVDARKNMMIFARLEGLIAGLSVDETIKRAMEYLTTGIDGIMIHSNDKDPEKVLEFIKKFRELPESEGKYVVCVPTAYNTIRDTELEKTKANVSIHANYLLRSRLKAEDIPLDETGEIFPTVNKHLIQAGSLEGNAFETLDWYRKLIENSPPYMRLQLAYMYRVARSILLNDRAYEAELGGCVPVKRLFRELGMVA